MLYRGSIFRYFVRTYLLTYFSFIVLPTRVRAMYDIKNICGCLRTDRILHGKIKDKASTTGILTFHLLLHIDYLLPDTSPFFQAQTCVDTLCKYMDNLLSDPNEEKFRKIRKSNRAFQERVAACEGHDLLLEAVGFETQVIDGQVSLAFNVQYLLKFSF